MSFNSTTNIKGWLDTETARKLVPFPLHEDDRSHGTPRHSHAIQHLLSVLQTFGDLWLNHYHPFLSRPPEVHGETFRQRLEKHLADLIAKWRGADAAGGLSSSMVDELLSYFEYEPLPAHHASPDSAELHKFLLMRFPHMCE